MGHMRLGNLPETASWRQVVCLLADGANVSAVAGATSTAAQKGLALAKNDPGLSHAVYLLSQLALAARQEDFEAALARVGIVTRNDPGLYDLLGAVSESLDRHFVGTGARTDIGEMAQLSAVESLTALLGGRSQSLFGTTSADIKDAARQLSTKKGFSTLAHDFFSRFTQRFLAYHLGRELSNHVGGNGRFSDAAESTDFARRLNSHCREAAEIVREFAGGWYSKANFEDGISPRKARDFASYALTKLGRELKVRGDRDG